MFKLVVCDLDGTLLDAEHRLDPRSRGVLGLLRERDVAVMLASGRHFQDIRRLSQHLGGNGYLISSNGAAVHDGAGRLLHSTAIPPDCVDFLITDPAFGQVHKNIYRSEDWLVERPEPRLLRYHQESGFAYRLSDLAHLAREDILKVFYYGERDQLLELESVILDRFAERLTTTFSIPTTLEVMASGVSKGAALTRVCAELGIALAETIAFGDGMNDLEMLSLVGKGVLMENADPRLKSALPHLERIGHHREPVLAAYLESVFGLNPAPAR